jgi:uncharacterized phage infection (PIP) family protein YhgE
VIRRPTQRKSETLVENEVLQRDIEYVRAEFAKCAAEYEALAQLEPEQLQEKNTQLELKIAEFDKYAADIETDNVELKAEISSLAAQAQAAGDEALKYREKCIRHEDLIQKQKQEIAQKEAESLKVINGLMKCQLEFCFE